MIVNGIVDFIGTTSFSVYQSAYQKWVVTSTEINTGPDMTEVISGGSLFYLKGLEF
jgi:hypothetical protein